ncbi:uncharacterized protein LOC116415738 [Nasonia vitripennis]|uniref:Uncharacterized protein n=1 Tax=Nasonia vitripennis TaxID=7425 RepID=A0A7M7PWC7_NASVI|nr:uncharacterized protein LOC116415738 [Nasonia vitripennis]
MMFSSSDGNDLDSSIKSFENCLGNSPIDTGVIADDLLGIPIDKKESRKKDPLISASADSQSEAIDDLLNMSNGSEKLDTHTTSDCLLQPQSEDKNLSDVSHGLQNSKEMKSPSDSLNVSLSEVSIVLPKDTDQSNRNRREIHLVKKRKSINRRKSSRQTLRKILASIKILVKILDQILMFLQHLY